MIGSYMSVCAGVTLSVCDFDSVTLKGGGVDKALESL